MNTIEKVWHDQASQTFLQTLYQNLPRNLQEQAIQILQHLVNSLEVTKIDTRLPGNIYAPTFNIYTDGQNIQNDNT